MRAAALAVPAIALWATGVLPAHLTGVAFLLFAMLLAVAPAAVVFSGFHSVAVWLVFSGLVLGVAIRTTGLGAWISEYLLGVFGASYRSLVGGIMIVGVLFSLVLPSSLGRIIILLPIITALCDRLGFAPGSHGRTGLVMAAGLGTLIPAFAVLPANVPNIVLAGSAETLYGISMTYGGYLVAHMPVTGILRGLAVYGLILVMFPASLGPAGTGGDGPGSGTAPAPLSPQARLLALVLAAALLLWATDFLHGVSPAWVALAAAFFCLLPGVGLVAPRDFDTGVSFAPVLYIVGLLGLGAVVAETGLGEVLGRAMLGVLDLTPGQDFKNYLAMIVAFTLTPMVTTTPAMPAIVSPLAAEIATATGIPLWTVLMAEVTGFATIVLPYQMPPVVLTMQMGKVPYGHCARLTLALAAVSLVLFAPLNYLWWQALGYFG